MGYWSLLITLCITAVLFIYILQYTIRKRLYKVIFGVSAVFSIISLIFILYLSIDIPNALSGREEMYVSEFSVVAQGDYSQIVAADNLLLFSFNKYDSGKHEQDAKYCIKYTKHIGVVMEIERVK